MITDKTVMDAKNDDALAMEEILKEHKRMIFSIVNSYKMNYSDYNLSKEDMFQEGLLGLVRAVKLYEPDKNVKFITFAYKIVNRYVGKEFKRQCSRYIEEGVSYSKFDEVDHFINQRTTYVSDNPIEYIESKTKEELLFDLISDLKEIDKLVIKLRLMSYSYDEIAEALNISKKKVDYCLRKVRKTVQAKMKNIYE